MPRDFVAGHLFNGCQILAVFCCGDGKGMTLASGPAGSTNTVYVIFGMDWHIEVDNMAHVRDIQAAGGDIRTNKKGDFAGFEFSQRLGPRRLGHVAV